MTAPKMTRAELRAFRREAARYVPKSAGTPHPPKDHPVLDAVDRWAEAHPPEPKPTPVVNLAAVRAAKAERRATRRAYGTVTGLGLLAGLIRGWRK